MKKFLTLIAFLCALITHAQYSKTHYIGPIMAETATNVLDQYLYISTPSTTPVHVRLHAYGSGIVEQTITRNSPWIYNLGTGFSQMAITTQWGAQIVNNKGYHIEATDLVNVSYRLNAVSNNHAGNIVSKGMAALGTNFRTFHMTPVEGSQFQGSFANFVTILATENNTQVTITNIGENAQDPLFTLYENPTTVTLQAGETYVMPATGLSANLRAFLGAKVSSTKPVAVNAGSFIGTNGEMLNADLGFDQIVPVERTGQEYIFVKSTGSNNVERAFLVADQDNTQIFANGMPNPVATINAGEYYSFFGNDFGFNGSLYVYTSKPTSAYQGIGDGQRGDQANQEMFFVPPLSCETPKNISSIPQIERIGNMLFTGRATLVTKAGSTIGFTINEMNFTLAELASSAGYTISGPHTVIGNTDYVSYTIVGLRGNVSIQSTSQLYLASYGTSQAATFGGYYSGFIYKPEITFSSENIELTSCIPHTTLSVNEVNGFDTYQWYLNDQPIAGATQSSYYPTQEGIYKVIAYLTECNTSYESDAVPVSSCGPDYDNDGIIDNLDLDWDGDGIANCVESYGNQTLTFQSNTAQITWPEGNRTYTHTLLQSNPGEANHYLSTSGDGSIHISNPIMGGIPTVVNLQISEQGALEITPIGSPAWNTNFDAEYIVRSPNLRHITLVNENNSLLIDTNYDGTYEPFVTQQTGYEIRFKINNTTSVVPSFRLLMSANDALQFEVRNFSETLAAKLNLQYVATCLPKDSDGDGIPDQWDLDADNDGIPDYYEQIGDLGLEDPKADLNGNGLADFFESNLPTDTDQDGVPNYLDWDADNNGIFDRVENHAGATAITNAGNYPALSVNEFGAPTATLYSTPASVYDIPLFDSDQDGIPNAFSLDNDGDGCFDTLETGISDADTDGIPGTGSVTVQPNGTINGFNYTAVTLNPLMNDPNVLEVLTEIDFPVICLNQTVTLPIDVANGVTIQWQMSTNNVDFVNIPNNALYQGSSTAALTIAAEAVTAELANHYFRIQLSNPQAPCVNHTQSFQLNVQQSQVATITEISQCEDDIVLDGQTSFDLTYYSLQLNGQSEQISIEWYLNETDLANGQALSGTWINQTNPQQLVMVVSDAELGCQYTQEVLFRVTNTPNVSLPEWAICDTYNNPNPGEIHFDLTAAATQLIGANTYTYYTDLADALSSTNAIADPSEYLVANQEEPVTIYIRQGPNWHTCQGIYYLPLRVKPLPEVDANLARIPHIICTASSQISSTLYALEDQALATLYTYRWYRNQQLIPGATQASLAISQIGEYEVHVRNAEGCEVIRYIPVTHSSQAVVDEVIITDFLEDRTVRFTLELPAYGQYEYSIDQPSAFQPTPYFEGLSPGRHVLYINDKLGCGITAYPIYVLGIPPFFTPNGDGYNDYWNTWGDDPQNPRIKSVHLFDRFGKLLAQLDPRGQGWDGQLNGKPLPSTDYWYRIETLDGQTVRGHFTLKR